MIQRGGEAIIKGCLEIMNNRPQFSSRLTVEEFEKHYWYKTELEKICREYDLPSQGTKAELQVYIKEFLSGRKPSNKRAASSRVRKSTALSKEEITLDTKLIGDGFKLNKDARSFFAEYFNVEKFSFTKDMAIALRKAEEENNLEMTVRDLIKVYVESKSNKKGSKKKIIENEEEKTYQWNNFVRDFFEDENTKVFNRNMKVAAYLWSKVRDNPGEKRYSSELLEEYRDELEKL